MDDFVNDMKRKQWRAWFDEPIPMLHNMTPRQAAQTISGQGLLDQLLAFFDYMRECNRGDDGPFIDVNVPTKWAKWKLGYGPGSAQEFAQEEAIFNSRDTNLKQPTERTERHQGKLSKKKKRIYIPLRCEFPECDKNKDKNKNVRIRQCSKCQCVHYCCKEHQLAHWPIHKRECKFLSKYEDLELRYFETTRELEKFPLSAPPADCITDKDKDKCFVCHAKAGREVQLGRTPCCNLPVCDNDHEYQLMSYSRDHCKRSHMLYTKCHTHTEAGHPGDWRECVECNAMEDNNVRPFAITNGFNYTPALEMFLPRGSFLTMPCDGCSKNRILPGHDASTFSKGRTLCQECSND